MWWWFGACVPDEVGGGVQSAEPSACLDAPEEGLVYPITVEGLATGDGDPDGTETWDAGARCDTVTRRLELVDAEQRFWRVGYGWSEGGHEATQALALRPEQEIAVAFHAGEANAGFVITELGRVVAAVSVGIADPGLPDGAVPGLEVSDGRTTGTEPTDCGTRVARAVRFDGDGEALELEPVNSDWMRVDGVEVRAWAFTAWGYRDATCPEDGELSWATWRQ